MPDMEQLMDQARGGALAATLDMAAQFDDLPEGEAAFQFALLAIKELTDVIPIAMMAGTLAVRMHRTQKINNLGPGPSPA